MENHEKQIEKIISEMDCPKNFKCFKSGFKNLGRAEDVDMESFVKCLETNAWECDFSFAFASYYLCKCPLRVYILKNLGR